MRLELELHQAMLELSIEGIVAHTLAGDLLYGNKAAEEQLGGTIESFRSKGPWSWVSEEIRSNTDAMVAVLKDKGVLRFEARRLKADGCEIWREVQAQVVETTQGPVVVSFMRDVTDRVHAERVVRHLAYHDAGTGLANRALLLKELESAICWAKEHGDRISVIFFDVDNFKSINDTYGHLAGDAVLKEVGIRLSSRVREQDIVARVGGDEFVVALLRLEDGVKSTVLRDRLVEAVTEPMSICEDEIRVEVSAGLADFQSGDDATSMITRADMSMYASRNNVVAARILA